MTVYDLKRMTDAVKPLTSHQISRIIFLLKEAVEDVELGRKPNPLYALLGGKKEVAIRGCWAGEAKGLLDHLELEEELEVSASVKATPISSMMTL